MPCKLKLSSGLKSQKFSLPDPSEIEAQFKREYEELEKKAKKKEKLIFPLVFNVLEANYSTSPINQHNGVMGPRGYSWLSGVSIDAKFKVKPQDNSIPITQLEFSGFSSIKTGDTIRAYVPKYEKRKGRPTSYINGEQNYAELYLERPFTSSEKVAKLELLAKDNKVLATFEGLFE